MRRMEDPHAHTRGVGRKALLIHAWGEEKEREEKRMCV